MLAGYANGMFLVGFSRSTRRMNALKQRVMYVEWLASAHHLALELHQVDDVGDSLCRRADRYDLCHSDRLLYRWP